MLSEIELLKCPSPWLRKWLIDNESEIVTIATVYDSYDQWNGNHNSYYEDGVKREQMVELLYKLWEDIIIG